MISIAMTTYNGAQFVQAQLRSILEQTRQPDEIIICDDGSRDDTVNIIRHVMETSGTDRIRLVENEENLGYIRNFYKAISLTKGDYIFLADQDDIWHREKLEKSLAIMERTGAAAICTRSRLIDQDGQEMDGNAFIVSVLLSRLKEELGFPAERLQYVYGAIRANKWIPVNMEVEHFLIENGINLDTRYTLLSRGNVIRLHEAGLQVNVWTVNRKKDMEYVIRELGVDMVTTEFYHELPEKKEK